MWLKEYLRNSRNTRFLKGKGDRKRLILPERITDSTGLSLKKHRQRRQNASVFFDKPVLQHTGSDQFTFCASTTLHCENIRKERSALQALLIGPPLQLGTALPGWVGIFGECQLSYVEKDDEERLDEAHELKHLVLCRHYCSFSKHLVEDQHINLRSWIQSQ